MKITSNQMSSNQSKILENKLVKTPLAPLKSVKIETSAPTIYNDEDIWNLIREPEVVQKVLLPIQEPPTSILDSFVSKTK